MVVAQSGALRSGLFRTLDIGWLEGIDGGCPERSFAERPFRTFDLGRRLGTMVVRSEALRSGTFPNIQLRAVGGVRGG